MTLKNSENNGTEEIGLVTPTPAEQTMGGGYWSCVRQFLSYGNCRFGKGTY